MRLFGVMKICLAVMGAVVFVPIRGEALPAGARVPTSMAQVQWSFAPVVKQAAPAVVNIYTKKVVVTRG